MLIVGIAGGSGKSTVVKKLLEYSQKVQWLSSHRVGKTGLQLIFLLPASE